MKRKTNFPRYLILTMLLTIVIVLLFNIRTIDKLTLFDFIPVLGVFFVFGTKDFRMYLKYKKSVNEGISAISNCLPWGIDNLIITCNPDKFNQIIVRNDLLWIEKHKNMSTDDLFKNLITDFEVIANNWKFKRYLKNKSIVYNLYSSDLNEEQLLKTEEKNYVSQHVV